jgi:hypothetical protein
LGIALNFKGISNQLYYHGIKKFLKDKYFGKLQLRTPEIPQYIPDLLYSVELIAEKYIRAFHTMKKFVNKSFNVNMY